jgi:uncharacterized membrane protein
MKRRVLTVLLAAMLALAAVPALAGPRSGGSFGGRIGFRSSPGAFSPSYSRPSYGVGGGGTHFVFLPSFGWGWGGYGMGGFGLLGTLFMLGVVGFGAVVVLRALRRVRETGGAPWSGDEGDVVAMPGRAYVYKVQLALGRSARGIQDRLAQFAEGDTASEAGLASLVQQTALELMREKDSIRYGAVESAGPMSFTNGETKMNSLALAERSRFQVERVRGVEGKVRRAETAATEGAEALEYVVVTLIAATRTPLTLPASLDERDNVDALLSTLGGLAPDALLGLEVIWTPADSQDSLTETDLMTTYPHLRGVG